MNVKRLDFFFVLIVCVLAVIGLLAGFFEAVVLLKRDGHTISLILWFVLLGLGIIVVIPMLKSFFRILKGKW
ncbi:MAG: hypothetical protein ABFD50_17915 [Smithella sp.]